MKCLAPVHLKNKYTGQALWTSCGKCSHCLENNRERWLLRLAYHLKSSYLGVHCTLQFSDEYIGDNVLDKKELQNLFKRLRHHFSFSYYAIGEYGTLDHRKHYHVAFFVSSQITFQEFHNYVTENWPYGYVYFTRLKRRRLAYVLHYHVRPKKVDDKPTFQLFSKGLGSSFFDDPEFRDFCIRNNTICIRDDLGKIQPLPRYYRKKFGYEIPMSNFSTVKTQLDNISKMSGKPIYEMTTQEVNKYKAYLFMRDYENRMKKYNLQEKRS